jgi:hypothetical protein
MTSRQFAARLAATIAALMLGGVAAPARADLIPTALDSTASPGGSGTFDVILKNTGAFAVDIGGFQVELSVPSTSGVEFTDANRMTTDRYIFASAPGPGPLNADPGNPFPNTDFIAQDTYFAPPATSRSRPVRPSAWSTCPSRSLPGRPSGRSR